MKARRYKLLYVLRDKAARVFIVSLARAKEQFHCTGPVPHAGFDDFVFIHRDSGRYYRLQGNYCVIVYEQAS